MPRPAVLQSGDTRWNPHRPRDQFHVTADEATASTARHHRDQDQPIPSPDWWSVLTRLSRTCSASSSLILVGTGTSGYHSCCSPTGRYHKHQQAFLHLSSCMDGGSKGRWISCGRAGEAASSNETAKSEKGIVQYVLEMRDGLERYRELAQENLRQAQQAQKKWYDQPARTRELQPGQKVLLLLPTSTNKLLMKWQGPYTVVCKMGPVTYEIHHPDKGKATQTYHINLLKEWKEPPSNLKHFC